jgi:menaquinone-dependent protoporphyrinogen IX oxidase
MKIQSLKLVCFSPTGTTRSIIQSLAGGINQSSAELIDITKPKVRTQELQTSEDELLIVGVPVYMGRVPALLNGYMRLRLTEHLLCALLFTVIVRMKMHYLSLKIF